MKGLTTEVLIVGAGPYGISLSYDLHAKGMPFIVVGYPFSLWQKHTLRSMTLRSDINASQVFSRNDRFNLRGYLSRNYDRKTAEFLMARRIPVDVFRGYTNWILGELPYRPVERKVVRLRQRSEGTPGFVAELDDGSEISAHKVVLASGIESHQVLPECLRRFPDHLVLHSWRVSEFEHFVGKRLLVVGGGQSAAEILAHLSRENQITWIHRSRLIFFAEPINLPRPLFAAVLQLSTGYYFLPRPLRKLLGRRFVASTITPELRPSILNTAITRIKNDVSILDLRESGNGVYSPSLNAGFDCVIASTGYRYSLASIGYLEPSLIERIDVSAEGIPKLGYDFSTSVPNLYMIGGIAEPTHGPAQRFMLGAKAATLRVSMALGA
jgi:cation diffusion facilitator CzcD-associated flavoprotein CzcO